MAQIANANLPFRNALLNQLSPRVLQRLYLEPLELKRAAVLYEANAPIDYAFFPDSGVVSVAAIMQDGASIEVGTVGNEGMVCSVLVLEFNSLPYRCFVQVEGAGYRVAAKTITDLARTDQEFRSVVLRYEGTFRIQAMQGIACNGLHSAQQRCCKWLLMTRDRVDSNELRLTHDFLAVMLGVRRATVSEVLAPLQDLEIVNSHRGTITILDPEALQARACECYRLIASRELDA